MKNFVLMVAMGVACVVAFAQDEPGSSCTTEGAFSSSMNGTAMDTDLCTSGKWVVFKKGGEKTVLIAYTITGEGLHKSGSIATRDGVPGSFQSTTEEAYDVSAIKDKGGKIVKTKGVVTTGYSMMVAPLILANGAIQMHVQYWESALNSMKTVSAGDLSIQTPEVSRVSTRNIITVDIGKEMVIPIEGVTASGKSLYTLKLVATVI